MASILVKDVSSESGGKLRLLFFLNYFRGLLKVATRQPSLLKGSVHMKCHQISKALFNSRFLYNSLRRSTPLGISDAGENLPKILCRRESSKTIESWAQNSYFTPSSKCSELISGFLDRPPSMLPSGKEISYSNNK